MDTGSNETCRQRQRIPAPADSGQQGPPSSSPPPRVGRPLSPRPKKSDAQTCLIVGIVVAVGIFVMIFVVGILAAIMLPALTRAREAARRASCQNNLRQMGIVYKMWANEDKREAWPPLAAVQGDFCFNPDDVYPEYMTDPLIMACPSDPTPPTGSDAKARINDESYFYLGYAMTNESEAKAFLEAYQKRLAEGGDFDTDLPVAPGTGTGGGDFILRLREDLGKPLEADENAPVLNIPRQSDIPIMFDREAQHIPEGINVLYMDGHVTFMRMGTEFPAQQWFLDALAGLEPQ